MRKIPSERGFSHPKEKALERSARRCKNLDVLLTLKVLEEIRAQRIDVAFRRWRKPTVKVGGRLRTAIGELNIGAVDVVDPLLISDTDAQRAGFASANDLRADLFRERSGGARARTARPTEDSEVYRVEVAYAGEDKRIAMRTAELTGDELTELVTRLHKIDTRTARGPWTGRTLALIEQWPARRAPELAELEGLEIVVFKASVRKLKELGLTESLTVGYRLSPRGAKVLAAHQAGAGN